MNNSTFDMIIGVSLSMVGLVGVGYAIGTKSKMNKICEKLDTSIDNLASDININIPDAMIDKAVKKAIKNKTEEAVDYAVSEVTKDFKNDIHTRVSTAVESEYLNIKDKVLDEITNRVADIDEKRLRNDVYSAAKAKAIEKFDDNLDDILEKFNNDLENVSKIYKSIANTFTKNDGKEMTFRIG